MGTLWGLERFYGGSTGTLWGSGGSYGGLMGLQRSSGGPVGLGGLLWELCGVGGFL